MTEQAHTLSFRLWWGLLGCVVLMIAILLAGPYGDHIAFLPDSGAAWYFWQRPDPTVVSRLSAWLSYAAHQLSIWWLIFLAQRRGLGYVTGMHPINLAALLINGLFVVWHIVQTRWFYDGLAQDVSIFTSFGSVAILLMLVVIMENQRRGVLFGKRWNWLDQPGRFLRKYHGYYFSWAVIYTFWYHPIEMSLGHLLGTFYTIMLMLQGSLFFTRAHVNRNWTVLLEVFVLVHGATVAWLALDNQSWAMFAFGFGSIFIITQMHGLGWSRALRWLVAAVFLAAWFLSYYPALGFGVVDALRIPLIYVISVPLLALVVTAISRSRKHRE
ncbi:MAG: hypothetical protein ABJ308_03770 [Halieaceae bacterium]